MLPQAQLLIYSPVVSFQMNTLEYFWMKKVNSVAPLGELVLKWFQKKP